MYQVFGRYIIRFFIVGFFIFQFGILHAQTYYVSSLTGDDRNNGTSPATAWATIDAVNRWITMLRPGSSVLFERGGIYYGSITIPTSVRGSAGYPITFGAYGEGDMPILSGAKQITGWEQIDKDMWIANVTDRPESINALFIDGKKFYPARFPKTGFRRVTSRYSGGLQDNRLNFPDGYWNGATVAFKVNDWTIYRDEVAYSYSDGRIDKNGSNSDQIPGPNWGYFLQNHINALDAVDEWVYDRREYTLTLCTDKNPNEQLVEYMYIGNGVRINSSNTNCYIHIENLCFQYYRNYAIYAGNIGRNLEIRHNAIINCWSAINVTGLEDCLISENIITDMESVGVNLLNISNSSIKNNNIRRVATSLDGGQNGWCGGGIALRVHRNSTHCEITGNRLDSIGYNGFSLFYAHDLLIKNNVINYSMLSFTDGGGIYFDYELNDPTDLKNTEVIDNIILNTVYGISAVIDTPNRVIIIMLLSIIVLNIKLIVSRKNK